MKRQIIKIDEDKCTGCGACVSGCHEGALKIVNGKARLMGDFLCDGLGACIGKCPVDAITIETREADKYDDDKVNKHSKSDLPCGCPGTMMKDFRGEKEHATAESFISGVSELKQWPVQLKLLSPLAPYFDGADLVIAADCVPFTYPNFHSRFLKGKALAVFCPKLDDSYEAYADKLAMIIKQNKIKSITTVHMEVPCCSALTAIAEEAVKRSGKNVVIKDHMVSIRGELV